MTYISVDAFRALYSGTEEFAVIDPREELFFARGHLFAATNMPLSRLELLVGAGVPNSATHIIFCDDGEGRAERAAEVLVSFGYEKISILQGGLPAWALTGGAVFSGVSVPSKAFGEVIERDLKTPTLSALELRAKLDGNEDFLLLDARPLDEHRQYCIPGSISCPSAEMILRAAELEPFRDKDVVVHCAGRTRSIVGAQTLIDSGLFKSVRSLCNGTPGWEFEGMKTEKGSLREASRPECASVGALNAAEDIRASWSIPTLDTTGFDQWRQGDGTRYVFDIRSAEEYAAGHMAGARHIAGGQLLQTTEKHIIVQNAHIVLIDSDGVRATTTAMWLRRMGWRNVVTHTMDIATGGLETGFAPEIQIADSERISLEEAVVAYREGQAQFCDLRPCHSYRRGHIPGSAYLTRAELEIDLAKLSDQKPLILIADDAAYGALVLRNIAALEHQVRILHGGMAVWFDAGNPVETGIGWLLSRPTDTYFESDHYDDFQVHLREHHAYLNWETALIDHIVGDPAVRYEVR